MDNIRHRHITSFQSGYDPVLEPIVFDEKRKTKKPFRISSIKLKNTLAPALATIRNFYNKYYNIIHPLSFTFLSFLTRFYLISLSDVVMWDESHFGKFASHYLNRVFYFDVHPPLGKMMVALAGLLAGYDGSFNFESGTRYPEDLNYTFMRMFMASFGVLMVPLAYFTSIELGFSKHAVILVTLMVLFDTAYLCISRFILLDAMLLFFTFMTIFCMTKFHNQKCDPFSANWWRWLIMTGISIGCVSSVKWIGLFTTALVGLYTIEDLWNKLGDLSIPKIDYLKHWVARIICLIVLPILIYIGCFAIHFAILTHSGPGDSQMSSLFQAGLIGNDFAENPLELAYGSRITLKNTGFGGGLLHSHVEEYPGGSGQQQVTCYHHEDINNDWIVLKPREIEIYDNETDVDVEFVNNGDTIRLLHLGTERNLHSHEVPAPLTRAHWEVSCYGNDTNGDEKDYWVIEAVDDIYKKTNRIRSLSTSIRFRHKVLGCYLRAANIGLPDWGFRQVEVTCDKRNNPKDIFTHWNIERHWNSRLPPGGKANYKSKFLRDFWNLNVAMYNANNALVADPDGFDILTSKPRQWPILEVGLRMCNWASDLIKFYLLGNPAVWWSGTVSLIMFILTLFCYLVRRQRQYNDFSPVQWTYFLYVGRICLIGWLLHYLPFYIMGRVTYLHHYFPALYFSILMAGFLMDHFTASCSLKTKNIIFSIHYALIITIFWYFKDTAYGVYSPNIELRGKKWLNTWDIVD
ncbi:8620_t:CDS:10 [Funneliformis geosporum]|uniref:Dolichyl-phosphate-mannose--protein mannosyltransferase n=1 Tax=Funneliformis geosporum TaxID=1117311 RepID=A0A9W4WKZ8_9GLOM|nr:8620_t:CDS:10 [Funneliformis geosporum]